MPNFPTSIDTDESLFLAVNNLRTQLTASISAATLTIPVDSTANFPDTGFITILTGTDITQAEAISYTSKTATTFTASARGAGGTPASAHDAGNNVDLTVVAAHHNELKDAIIAVENFLGIAGSENFVPKDPATGNVVLSGTLSVQDDTVVSGTLFVQGDTLVSGALSVQGDTVVSGTFTAVTGTFTESLTISGVAVPLSVDLQSAYDNGDGTIVIVVGKPVAISGPGVVVTTAGDIDMQGNVLKNAGVVVIQPEPPDITVSGLLWFDTDEFELTAELTGGITNASGTFTESLTISGVPTATGTSLSVTRSFFTAPTSGAAATVENIVVIEGGIIQSWGQT